MQRLPDSNDDTAAKEGLFSGDLPVLQPVEFTAQRTQRRADLMLDDACLLVSSMECRKSVPLYVRLFYLLSLLTLGTVAIVAQWPFCRLRAVRATSVPCQLSASSPTFMSYLMLSAKALAPSAPIGL